MKNRCLEMSHRQPRDRRINSISFQTLELEYHDTGRHLILNLKTQYMHHSNTCRVHAVFTQTSQGRGAAAGPTLLWYSALASAADSPADCPGLVTPEHSRPSSRARACGMIPIRTRAAQTITGSHAVWESHPSQPIGQSVNPL